MAVRYAAKLAGLVFGGALGGWALELPGGVAGAALGLGLGALLDSLLAPAEQHELSFDESKTKEELDAELRRLFARHLCGVCLAVAATDGALRREEARAIREFFRDRLGYGAAELEVVRQVLAELVDAPPALEDAAAAADHALEPPVKLLLLEALYELAQADGRIGNDERRAIDEAARILGIPDESVAAVRAAFLGATNSAFEKLGLSPEADDQSLKRAWRKLAAEHHPDRVASLGPEAVALAEARFREISSAWDEIRRERGF